jgi:DNA-directed RNA polymerase subunit N
MNVPVRCYTCGRVLAAYVSKLTQAFEAGRKDVPRILLEMGIPAHRVCCRRMLLTYVADE